MAIASEGLDAHRLDSRWNFPTHHRHRAPGPPPNRPSSTTTDGEPDGSSAADGLRHRQSPNHTADATITEIWHDAFPNATFWEWRYTEDPDSGRAWAAGASPWPTTASCSWRWWTSSIPSPSSTSAAGTVRRPPGSRYPVTSASICPPRPSTAPGPAGPKVTSGWGPWPTTARRPTSPCASTCLFTRPIERATEPW